MADSGIAVRGERAPATTLARGYEESRGVRCLVPPAEMVRAVIAQVEDAMRRLDQGARWKPLVDALKNGSYALTMEEAARLLGLKRSQFWKAFLRRAGMTWGRFMHGRRLVAAYLEAAAEPEAKLSRVAKDVGYATRKDLARAFAEYWHRTVRGRATQIHPRKKSPG